MRRNTSSFPRLDTPNTIVCHTMLCQAQARQYGRTALLGNGLGMLGTPAQLQQKCRAVTLGQPGRFKSCCL